MALTDTANNSPSVSPAPPVATLGDVARQAGVSVMAVSVVLNGARSNTRVSEATREKIRSVARELGYRPNAVARFLRKRRTNIIGFYGGYGFNRITTPFTAELYFGLQLGCEEQKKDLLLHGAFHQGASADDIYDELVGGKIDGLILLAPESDPLARRLAASNLPVVAVVDAISYLPSVVIQDERGGEMLAAHLLEKGHRTVAYRATNHLRVSQARRLAGFRKAWEAGGGTLQLCAETHWSGQLTTEDEAYLRLPEAQGGPSAIVCTNDLLAETTRRFFADAGFAIPGEKAVTGFDGAPVPFAPCQKLTTVHAPWMEVAKEAVALLCRRMTGEEIPAETSLPVTFYDGETT